MFQEHLKMQKPPIIVAVLIIFLCFTGGYCIYCLRDRAPDKPKQPSEMMRKKEQRVVDRISEYRQFSLWNEGEDLRDYAKLHGLDGRTQLAIGNGIQMKFLLIPSGKFLMGSPETEEGRHHDESIHEVIISRPFYMAEKEVRQIEYEEVMGVNPSHSQKKREESPSKPTPDYSDYPVENITFDEANAFCVKFGKVTGKQIHLPTEAQWEYACRGGTRTRFYSGSTPVIRLNSLDEHFDLGRVAVYNRTPPFYSPAPCGTKTPNIFGLYDMLGNVEEMCSDWYMEDYYRISPRDNPQGPESGIYRIRRGGRFNSDADACRSASRGWSVGSNRTPWTGFRVVMEIDWALLGKPAAYGQKTPPNIGEAVKRAEEQGN